MAATALLSLAPVGNRAERGPLAAALPVSTSGAGSAWLAAENRIASAASTKSWP